jgi:hypothetical protein
LELVLRAVGGRGGLLDEFKGAGGGFSLELVLLDFFFFFFLRLNRLH